MFILSNIYESMKKNTAYRNRIICGIDTIHRLFWEYEGKRAGPYKMLQQKWIVIDIGIRRH